MTVGDADDRNTERPIVDDPVAVLAHGAPNVTAFSTE